MGLFEFLMILISVVIGLGLAEVLAGAAGLLRARGTVRVYWLHVLFQVGVFFALLQQWWESWDLVTVELITFWAVLGMLLSPIILFLIAHLLFPSPPEGVDLKAYYYQQAPLLWGLVAFGALAGSLAIPWLKDEPLLAPTNLSGFPMAAICLVLVLARRERVHATLAPLVLVLVLLDTLLANPAISAR